LAETLAERLVALPSFARTFRRLVRDSVAREFPGLRPVADPSPGVDSAVDVPGLADLNYLLECASVLAPSRVPSCQDAALRIAQYSLNRADALDTQRLAAAVALDALTNKSALQLAVRRELLLANYFAELPLPMRLDHLRRALIYSKLNPDGDGLQALNAFQSEVYEALHQTDWLSISAPTSSGKSFILLQALQELLHERTAQNVVFIVPTRALIQQLEAEIRTLVQGMDAVYVTSVPRLPEDWKATRNVFVFTQERLHWLLLDAPASLSLDVLFVDEAQKVGDGSRGVLLDDVLASAARRSTATRFVFSSPLASNPEALLEAAPVGARVLPIKSEQVAVNQNLVWVSQIPGDTRQWSMELCHGEELSALGTVSLPFRPNTELKRLPMVAHALAGPRGGNLLYQNIAANAEKVANLLRDLEGPAAETTDQELLDLIELTKTVIHPQYLLATVLSRGIGFHYGNMPLLIRAEVERLFKSGKIRFLVCTATLMEGVNLPATTVFLRGPKRGLRVPITEIDFWNLAGRAGRQGMEFQGNVVCVDPRDQQVWKVPPPRRRSSYRIERRLKHIGMHRGDALLDYVGKGLPRGLGKEYQELDYAFSYFLNEHFRCGSLLASPASQAYPAAFVEKLSALCDAVAGRLTFPSQFIERNPGVSPLAMQALLEEFLVHPNPSLLVPIHAYDGGAVDFYVSMLGRMNRHLIGDPDALNFPRALLVVNWLRGLPLARIIAKQWDYWGPGGKNRKKLPAVIRDTLENIEEFVRFRFAKYAACYVDLLEHAIATTGGVVPLHDGPDLRLALEFGASARTQISLMGLGLSRTTALALSQHIADDSLDGPGCLVALADLNLEGLGLSPIIMDEVRRLFDA
jgi:hypothetical protein